MTQHPVAADLDNLNLTSNQLGFESTANSRGHHPIQCVLDSNLTRLVQRLSLLHTSSSVQTHSYRSLAAPTAALCQRPACSPSILRLLLLSAHTRSKPCPWTVANRLPMPAAAVGSMFVPLLVLKSGDGCGCASLGCLTRAHLGQILIRLADQ